MGKIDLAQCSADFLKNSTDIYSKYLYKGPVRGIYAAATDRPVFITLEGCRKICGTGSDYYPWKDSSATISTWVLPVVGLILQAPFESNEFWNTCWALARWLGSPVASLSYTFWNIKVTGKCALMVDMATGYDEFPPLGSQFTQMRDSLYILGVMNQYSIKQRVPPVEAEKLLRIALFSDSLRLTASEDRTQSLIKRRQELAHLIRENRRRGVVPVFVSLMWFLFSLGISIQAAFGQLGTNATAHDLALGLLLAWLPVLIMNGIVDRNPVSVDSICFELNRLLDDVRLALLNPDLRNTYMRDTGRTDRDFAWTNALNNEDFYHQDFFTGFAGQGRVRWHYGVAHPILAGIESGYVAKYGRDWLRNPDAARTAIILGATNPHGLRWFDFRMIWQILSALFITCGAVGGAFILSYYTPTVGLGCRSGGYLIFICIALGEFAVELLVWWLTPDSSSAPKWINQYRMDEAVIRWGSNFERRLFRTQKTRLRSHVQKGLQAMMHSWTNMTFRDRIEFIFLRPCEVINSAWLVYIVLAQTFGSYRNCNCMASIWGLHGGYIDWETYEMYRQRGVALYWGSGTALSCFVMALGLAFIVSEYCTQSHISTEDYENAARGLRRTRRYKKYTNLFRSISNHVSGHGKRLFYIILRRRVPASGSNLVWSSSSRHPRALGYGVEGPISQTPAEEWEDHESLLREPSRSGSESLPVTPYDDDAVDPLSYGPEGDSSDQTPLRRLQRAQIDERPR